MLYSSSARGNVVESLYVRLRRDGWEQTFSFWACGERDHLASGCGLYVDREGVSCNHHFLVPREEKGRTEFVAGEYELSVYATFVGQSRERSLSTLRLTLSEGHARHLASAGSDYVGFIWGPASAHYTASLHTKDSPAPTPWQYIAPFRDPDWPRTIASPPGPSPGASSTHSSLIPDAARRAHVD